jgi:hypothetical protein
MQHAPLLKHNSMFRISTQNLLTALHFAFGTNRPAADNTKPDYTTIWMCFTFNSNNFFFARVAERTTHTAELLSGLELC